MKFSTLSACIGFQWQPLRPTVVTFLAGQTLVTSFDVKKVYSLKESQNAIPPQTNDPGHEKRKCAATVFSNVFTYLAMVDETMFPCQSICFVRITVNLNWPSIRVLYCTHTQQSATERNDRYVINPQHCSKRWYVELTRERKWFCFTFVAHSVIIYKIVYFFPWIIKGEVTKPLFLVFIC